MTTANEKDQFYLDVFTTAIQGGVNYWADIDVCKYIKDGEYDYEGFHAVISDIDEQKSWRVNRKTLIDGFKKAFDDDVQIGDTYRKEILVGYAEKDAGDIDAGNADIIVQLGLFGEVVYS